MPSTNANQHRPTASFIDQIFSAPVNIGQTERALSLVGGGLMAWSGLMRGRLLMTLFGAGLLYRGATGHCGTYQLLGVSTACPASNTTVPAGQGVQLEERIFIRRSPKELFDFWGDFENLPQIMDHLVSVQDLGEEKSHWVAQGPTGEIEWDAEVYNERPYEMIAWRSLPNSEVQSAGSVHFHPLQGGTEVVVMVRYNPPGGKVGAALAWLAGEDAENHVRDDLKNFKRVMETGTLPHSTT